MRCVVVYELFFSVIYFPAVKSVAVGGYPYRAIDFIGSLVNDSINGLMWMGTNDGVYVYDFNGDSIAVPFGQQALSVSEVAYAGAFGGYP